MTFSIENVTKKFEKRTILNSVSIYGCSLGSCVALLGKNGAGKTTLINFVVDLIDVESGYIKLNDKVISPNSMEWKRLIGVSLVDILFPEDFSGREYLLFVGKLHSLSAGEIEIRSNSLIDFFFGDPSILSKKIGAYSVGMKRKIAICASLLHKPKVLILDEPFSGLDIESIELLRQFFKYYLSNNNSIFMTSHNLMYVGDLLTRVVVLDEGIIKFDGSPESFTNNGRVQLNQALFDMLTIEPKSTASLEWLS